MRANVVVITTYGTKSDAKVGYEDISPDLVWPKTANILQPGFRMELFDCELLHLFEV